MAKIIVPSSGKKFDSSQVDITQSNFTGKGKINGRLSGWEEPPELVAVEEDTLDLVFADVMDGVTIITKTDPITGPDAQSVLEQLEAVGVKIRQQTAAK